MKKFYYKKTVPQEEKPILQTLERSHTLLNALASDANSGEWHELPLRKKSTHLSDRESRKETISSIGSDDWSANSMVITDSDLASSWIYSRKKAAANSAFESVSSDPITPPTDGRTYPDPLADDIESPRVDFKRIPIAPTEESKSSCCCYMTVLLIIFICSFGILTSIGGVVYLEVFATPRTTLAADNLIANSDTMTTSVSTSSSPSVDGSTIGEDLNQESSTDAANQGTSQNPDKIFQSRRGKSLDITKYQDDEIAQSSLGFDPTSAKTEEKLKNTEYQEDSSQSDQGIFEVQVSSKVSEIILDTSSDTSKRDWSSSILNTEQTDNKQSEDDLLYSTMPEKVETVSSEVKSESKFENEGDSNIEVAATDFNIYPTSAMATEIDPEVELESKLEIITDNTLVVSDVEAIDAHTEKHISTTDTSTGRTFGRIQESIALVMKKFQRLESNTLPGSRIKDVTSTRRTLINTESSTVEADSKSEKQKYLEKIRKMMYEEKE